jgi:hypothetical protein
LESDLKQKQDHTDLCQNAENLRFVKDPEAARSDDDSSQKFAEDGCLTEPHHSFTCELGSQPNNRESN